MAIPLVVDGNTYSYPEQGDVGLATQATGWANAITGAVATAETNIAALQAVPVRAYAEYTTTAAQTYTNTAFTIANFGTLVTDTDSAVTTGASWKFTCPTGKGGRYLVSAVVTVVFPNATQIDLVPAVFKNGSELVRGAEVGVLTGTLSSNEGAVITTLVNLVPTDFINMQVYQASGANRVATAVATNNRITIEGPF